MIYKEYTAYGKCCNCEKKTLIVRYRKNRFWIVGGDE